MADSSNSRPTLLGGEVGRAWSEVVEMLKLRRELAEAEIRSDLAVGRRLAIVGGLGLLVATTGLPVLVVSLSSLLETWLSISPHVLTLLLGATLLGAGLLVAVGAWRRSRREFLGLRQSLDELKEDLVWLHEWTDSRADRTPEEDDIT